MITLGRTLIVGSGGLPKGQGSLGSPITQTGVNAMSQRTSGSSANFFTQSRNCDV
jgi:hypothetical protein